MTPQEILAWLTSSDGGAFIFVSWAVSWLLEPSEKWQKLSSTTRHLIILGGTGLLGAGAAWLEMRPDIVEAITPYIQPLIYAVIAWLSSQIAHRLNPLRKTLEEGEAQVAVKTGEGAETKVSVEVTQEPEEEQK